MPLVSFTSQSHLAGPASTSHLTTLRLLLVPPPFFIGAFIRTALHSLTPAPLTAALVLLLPPPTPPSTTTTLHAVVPSFDEHPVPPLVLPFPDVLACHL